MHEVINFEEMDEILQKYGNEPSNIIAILQETQGKYG